MSDNKHPADELAQVRATLRELKEREAELRWQLIELPMSERVGAKYKAIVDEKVRKTIDAAKLETEIGDINRFYRTSDFILVKVERLK